MKKKKEMISNSKTKPQIQNKLNSMEVKADKIMKKCEEEKERNESPDNSDNEEIQNINKIIKNSIPQTSLNNINTKLNIEQCNNFSIKLLKDRGFDLEENEMKLFSNEIKEKKTKKTEMTEKIFGQSEATLNTLEVELKKALDKNNKPLICSILNTILSKESNTEKLKLYRFQIIDFLQDQKDYTECLRHFKILIESNGLDLNDRIKIYISLSKTKLELSEIWDGYYDLLKAKSLSMIESDTIKGYDKEKIQKQIEELLIFYEIKISKQEKNTLDFLYLTGSSKIGVLGVKEEGIDKIFTFHELKNRMINSISCQDHYSLAIVKLCHCIQNNFDFINCLENKKEQCSGESQVVGWGENTVGQIDPFLKISFVERPFAISFFIEKNIYKISTFKSVSIACDRNGNIYEWGSNIEGVKTCFKFEKEISDLKKGPMFSLILTNDGELYMWGKFILKEEIYFQYAKPTEISKKNKFINITLGNKHILAVNGQKELFGFGSNDFGQLCFEENIKEANEFVKIEKCKFMSVKKTFCTNNLSFVLTDEGELYYFGQLSSKKIIRYPAQTEFPEDVKINDVNGNGVDIFAITEKGEVLYWNTDTSPFFKQYVNTKNEFFKQIYVGKHYQLLLKPLILPEECYIIEEKQVYETFKKINLKIQIRDHNDICSVLPFFCLRYFLCISNSPSEDVKNMIRLCKDLVKNNQNKYKNHTIIFSEEILNHRMQNMKITQNIKTLHQFNLEFFLEKSGLYYLYIFINEELIKNYPFQLQIEKSSVEEENFMKTQEKLFFKMEKKKQDKLEKQKEIEDKKKEEQLLHEKKLQNTDKRAEETLKKHLQEKNETLLKEETEKKLKADLITGGGFDLEKSKKMKSETIQKKNFPVQKQPLTNPKK